MDPSGSHSALATDNSDDENRRPSVFDVDHFCTVTSLIQQEKYGDLLPLAMKKDPPLNLMEDPMLNVVIEYKKTDLAKRLIQNMPAEKNGPLWYANYHGDTALHVAATVGDLDVAEALLRKNSGLVSARNRKNETPLHKAALYGHETMFRDLVKMGSHVPDDRREDGATVLHCAIMGSAPVIPYEDSGMRRVVDEEQPTDSSDGETCCPFPINVIGIAMHHAVFPMIERLEKQKKTHKETLELIEFLAYYPKHMEFYSEGRRKGREKSPLAGDNTSSGTEQSPPSTDAAKELQKSMKEAIEELQKSMKEAIEELQKSMKEAMEEASGESTIRRWDEPPLILGAQMGLPEFVRTILLVCPQAAAYLDTKGRSVLQVAIENGNLEIVETIREMTQGNCPILPSWLLSTVEKNTKRTILHFASTKGPGDDQAAVQMQDELIWFEMVRDMVPRELVHYRNDAEKTAQEMFSESHKKMAKACKEQLVGMGQTCSGLLAAVVFASSFSIPGEKDPKTGNPVYFNRLPFRIFSHAFVIGLSSAATSLVLFLSLLVAPYKEQQFRRAIPIKYFFACLSFGIALTAFLVAFTCNIYLQTYGGQRSETNDLIILLLELLVFPIVCCLFLLSRGSYFLPSFGSLWR
ncbi:unnamed protein product [Musa acuminata var. zebrina]